MWSQTAAIIATWNSRPAKRLASQTYVPNSSTSPNKALGKFDRSVFRYIAADDEYECPAGQRMARRQTSEEKDMTLHRYWSDQCGTCELKAAMHDRQTSAHDPLGARGGG